MRQPRLRGKFSSQYREPRGKPLALRLPESLDKELRELAGDNLKQWVEDAIALKIKQEKSA